MKSFEVLKKRFVFIVTLALCTMSVPTVEASADNGETIWFPAYTMNVNQLAYENVSHYNQNAIDILPEGNVFAPFSGTIAYVDPNWGYVTLQSKDKVYWADGSYDYATVGFMHDSDVSNLYVGMELDQGEEFYQAGGMAEGNPNAYGAHGAHVHLTVHRGHVKRGYPYGNGDTYAFDAFLINQDLTTNYSGRGKGYAVSGMVGDAPADYSDLWCVYNSYLSECRFYPTAGTAIVGKKSTYFKTLPCSQKTCEDSDDIRKAKKGEAVAVTGIYENTAGNYWYRVIVDEQVGYLYSGDVDDFHIGELEVSGISAPESLSVGDRFSIRGIIESDYIIMDEVCGAIQAKNGDYLYLYRDSNVSNNRYDLLNSDIDMAMLFNELPKGEYCYSVWVEAEPYCAENGKELYRTGICFDVVREWFTVS